MSKYNLFKSILALVLTMAMFVSMVPGAFASTGTDREQIVVNASDLVAAETDEAQAERYEESVAKRLAEEYGLEDEEVEDTEFGYLSDEEREELGIATPPTVNDVVTPDYVFLNFNVGSSSRRMNWQMKTSSTKDQYFSQNKQGFLCAYYNGEDAFLYSPLETDPMYKTARLKGYQMKDGDIARVYIGSLKANALITSDGTATFNSNFFIHSSESEGQWTSFTESATKLTRKTGAHELTWNIKSSNVGDTLYGVRWDAIEETLSAETQIYIDYIYVGPKETAPVNVQYVDENDSLLTHGDNWVGWGKKAMAWSTGKENTDNGDGTQTIWGWSVYNKVNDSWNATGKFVTDPSTYVCKEDTRFKLTEVKIRKADLDSKQEYDNGESTTDDKYVLTIDGFDTAEMNLGGYGTPLDVCIVMDRSGSQGEFVEKMDFGANQKSVEGNITLTQYLETLDKSMDPGYYRATAFRQRKSDGMTSKGISQYIYTMPLRYYRGEWQMQCLIDCTCNKKETQTIAQASHQSYGIYRWNTTGALQCSHVQWIKVETGYDKFVEYLKNTEFSADYMGKEYTLSATGVKELLAFTVGVSRLGRTQEAIENFLERLYVSSTNLEPGVTHTVSVIGYGRTVFMSGYPYADANGGYKTKNAYADGSITSKNIDHTTYEKVLKVVNSPYIDGATRTDA
ncbi:MAG: hypothetical protein IKT58_03060, partial [Oscillospiraceae bacterium]|nr:hypothetical protein [Oscillospiraceae bacterium]